MPISADLLVDTTANIIADSSGNRLDFSGLVLTSSTRLPIGAIITLSNLANVKAYFGIGSDEAILAERYFLGFDNSTKKPKELLFWQHNLADVAAYLRGGSMAAVTLAQLQALSGTLTLTLDAETKTTASIDLSIATSFSDAASIIDNALATAFTAAISCSYDTIAKAFVILSGSTGTASTITFCTGTLSDGIKLSSTTGGVLSQGAVTKASYTASLDAIILLSTNWVSILTIDEPTTAEKLAVAKWVNDTKKLFYYPCFNSTTDTDILDANAITDFGSQLKATEYVGTTAIYGGYEYAAARAGMIASIDTDKRAGWITLAYKSQSGLEPTVFNDTDAATLEAKGYDFYGNWATRNTLQNFFMHGQSSGEWLWIDAYIGQIYLRDAIQVSELGILTSRNSVPHGQDGYDSITNVLYAEVINPAITLGVITKGNELSASQKLEIDRLTGVDGSADIVTKTGTFMLNANW